MFDLGELQAWGRDLPDHVASAPLDDPARIDLLRSLEVLKCTIEAVQAEVTADFDTSQRAAQAAAGVPAARQGRGVAAQVALARRTSHHRGTQHLGLAKILKTELPHTWAAFRAGKVTEWRVTILARETACLTLADRLTVDAKLAGDPDRLERYGDGELVTEAKKLAYQLDPASFVERRRRAEADRRVTLRPAPEVMSTLSALLPIKDGVAVMACLMKTAATLIGQGDERSRNAIMADTLTERVTGRAPAEGSNVAPTAAPHVVVDMVMDDDVLFGNSNAAAHLDGWGPIPADLARDLATQADAELRRLYAKPSTGQLVAMDSRARLFPDALARFIRLRDRFCRTPWCGAPIRHIDHAQAWEDGGPTNAENSDGLCEACNHAKQAPGWRAETTPGTRHTIRTVTPTGHTYDSTAPPAGTTPDPDQARRLRLRAITLTWADLAKHRAA